MAKLSEKTARPVKTCGGYFSERPRKFRETSCLPSEHTKRVDVTRLGVVWIGGSKLFGMHQFWGTPSAWLPGARLWLSGRVTEDGRRPKPRDTCGSVWAYQDIFLQ